MFRLPPRLRLTIRWKQAPLVMAILAGALIPPAGLDAQAGMPLLARVTPTEISQSQVGLSGILVPRKRTRSSLNQLYEFDRIPLGSRIPVIIVPGRAEEFQQNSWWKNLHHSGRDNYHFREHYKFYVFLYNSREELDVQAKSLAADIKKRFGTLPYTQPLMLVTYSLGGVISREVLADSQILNRVDTVIALATPFHGSPLFDPEWFTKYLNMPTLLPTRRFWDRLIYRCYMFGKNNLQRGLDWDNFDSSRPQFQTEDMLARLHLRRPNEASESDSAAASKPYVEYPNADEIRSKLIVYASYLQNGYTDPQEPNHNTRLPRFVLQSLSLPKTVFASILPVYGFTVHSVFSYMNLQLGNIATYTPSDPKGKNTKLYRYNDGAIPVSSMLFLKPSPVPYSQDIKQLVAKATVRKVRIFVNLDHTHLGQYSILKSKLLRPDSIHPEEGVRTPNEWIIRDLVNRLKERANLGTTSPNRVVTLPASPLYTDAVGAP